MMQTLQDAGQARRRAKAQQHGIADSESPAPGGRDGSSRHTGHVAAGSVASPKRATVARASKRGESGDRGTGVGEEGAGMGVSLFMVERNEAKASVL